MEQKKKKINIKILVLIAIVVLAIIGIIAVIKQDPTKKMTKDQMLQVAEELNIGNLNKEIAENQARVKDKYIGNIYKYSMYINNITDQYVEMGSFKVYLQPDELKKLSKNKKITVVGKIDNISIDTSKMGIPYSTKWDNFYFYGYEIEMKNAYFVSDTFEIVGILHRSKKSNYEYSLKIQDEIYLNDNVTYSKGSEIIYFDNSNGNIDTMVNKQVKIKAKMEYMKQSNWINSNSIILKDIENIENV